MTKTFFFRENEKEISQNPFEKNIINNFWSALLFHFTDRESERKKRCTSEVNPIK